MKKGFAVYKKLFLSSFYISIFIIGGGYVAIPLLKKRFVDELKWIEAPEMDDLVAIAQSAPGAIAVNSAVSVGYKIAGVPGTLCALAGTILPPLILISVIQGMYAAFIENRFVAALFRGMNAAVAAVMIDVVLSMGKTAFKGLKYFSLPLMALVFALAYFWHVNPIFIVLGSIVIGVALALLVKNRKTEGGKS